MIEKLLCAVHLALCVSTIAASHLTDLNDNNKAGVQNEDFKFNSNAREFVLINGSIFMIGLSTLEFFVAGTVCNDINMKLISIENDDKQVMITDYLDNNGFDELYFWTSGVHIYNQNYMWTSNGKYFKYTNWGPGEPKHQTQQGVCVYVNSNTWARKWMTSLCQSTYYYICEEI